MKDKIAVVSNKIIIQIKQAVASIDAKFTNFIPNNKLRKILLLTLGGLFGFMFLIIITGLILLPFRKDVKQNTGYSVNKTVIQTPQATMQIEISEAKNKILILQENINNLTFPESKLTIPMIKSDLTIYD